MMDDQFETQSKQALFPVLFSPSSSEALLLFGGEANSLSRAHGFSRSAWEVKVGPSRSRGLGTVLLIRLRCRINIYS